jgi:hypothetical protein
MHAIAAEQVSADRERLAGKGYLGPIEATVMRRAELHMQAEVGWHDEFAKILAAMPRDGSAGPPPAGPPPGGPPPAGPPPGGPPPAGPPPAGPEE